MIVLKSSPSSSLAECSCVSCLGGLTCPNDCNIVHGEYIQEKHPSMTFPNYLLKEHGKNNSCSQSLCSDDRKIIVLDSKDNDSESNLW